MGTTGQRSRAGFGRLYAAPIWALLCVSCGRQEDAGSDAPTPGSRTSDLIRRASQAFEQAGARTYSEPTQRVALIRKALGGRDRRRLGELMRLELNEHPNSAEALLVEGQLLYRRTAVAAARTRLESVLESVLEGGPTFERCERVFYLYGMCLLRLGESDQAREALLVHLRLRPGHDETLYSLGQLALQEGRPGAAIPYFEQALEGFRTNEFKQEEFRRMDVARVHARLGSAYLKLDDLERARESLEISLRLNPADRPTQYTLSRVLTRLGDQPGARRALEQFQQLKTQRARRGPVSPGPAGGKAGKAGKSGGGR